MMPVQSWSGERRWAVTWSDADAVPFELRQTHRCEISVSELQCEIWEGVAGRSRVQRFAFRSEAERDRFVGDYVEVRRGNGFVDVGHDETVSEGPSGLAVMGSGSGNEATILGGRVALEAAHTAFVRHLAVLPHQAAMALRRRVHKALFVDWPARAAGVCWSGDLVEHLALQMDREDVGLRTWLPVLLDMPATRQMDTLTVTWVDREPAGYEDDEEEESSSSHRFEVGEEAMTELVWNLAADNLLPSVRAFGLTGLDRHLDLEALQPTLPHLEVLQLALQASGEVAYLAAEPWDATLTVLDVTHGSGSPEQAEQRIVTSLQDGGYPRLRQLMVRGLLPGDRVPPALATVLAFRGIAWAPWTSPAPDVGEVVFDSLPSRQATPAGDMAYPASLTPALAVVAPYDLAEHTLTIGDPDPPRFWDGYPLDRLDGLEIADGILDEAQFLAQSEPYVVDDFWWEDYGLSWEIEIEDARGGWSPDTFFGPGDP